MILYNVTVNIEDDVHNEWLEWMKNEHIPEVMETGFFKEYKFLRIISRQPDETGMTYSIQYFAANYDDYHEYAQNHAPRLQEKTRQKFEGKFVAFRTLLETL